MNNIGDNMVRKSKGRMTKKTRYLGRSATRRQITVSDKMNTLEIGTKVQLVPNSKYPDFPAPRYAGRTGEVIRKQGSAYVVRNKDGRGFKILISTAIHLKEVINKQPKVAKTEVVQ